MGFGMILVERMGEDSSERGSMTLGAIVDGGRKGGFPR